VISMNSIAEGIFNTTLDVSRNYMLLHTEKIKNKHTGYRDMDEYEEFTIRKADPNLKYPTDPKLFKTRTDQYYDCASKLSYQILTAITSKLGMKKDITLPMVNNGSTLRIIHHFIKTIGFKLSYDEITDDPESLITIIAISSIPGLQIKHPTKGKWIPIESLATYGELLVIPGTLLHKYTNRVYPIIPHRLVTVAKDRFSLVFHCNINPINYT